MDVHELDDGGATSEPGSSKKKTKRGERDTRDETVEDLIAKLESKGKKVVLQDPNAPTPSQSQIDFHNEQNERLDSAMNSQIADELKTKE